MLNLELLRDDGILVLKPAGILEASEPHSERLIFCWRMAGSNPGKRQGICLRTSEMRFMLIAEGRSSQIAVLAVLSVGGIGEYELPASGVRMNDCHDRAGAMQ